MNNFSFKIVTLLFIKILIFGMLQGYPGMPGSPGLDGLEGCNGTDGKRGGPGYEGLQGARGEPGPDGRKGLPGEAGEGGSNSPGIKGDRGDSGLPGLKVNEPIVYSPHMCLLLNTVFGTGLLGNHLPTACSLYYVVLINPSLEIYSVGSCIMYCLANIVTFLSFKELLPATTLW